MDILKEYIKIVNYMDQPSGLLPDINQAWESFLNDKDVYTEKTKSNMACMHHKDSLKMPVSEWYVSEQPDNTEIPKCSDIYISTKTKIAYLNQEVNLSDLFWKLKIMPYATAKNGLVKKQMKMNNSTQEELDQITSLLKKEEYFTENIITHIVNPLGRIKFKDIRKINIGISKKDILSYRSKKKGAFYNCFALILRLSYDGTFREIHVKVFNTGKLEIPGIQGDDLLIMVLDLLIELLQPFFNTPLTYSKDGIETVLINSNFNCGYFINRDKLHDILKYKYKLHSIFDPCSYPGIQCKFYYDNEEKIQTGIRVQNKQQICLSFMIFRTGSVLIVGKCNDDILIKVYNFLVNLFKIEYADIESGTVEGDIGRAQVKKKKIKKITIMVDNNSEQ